MSSHIRTVEDAALGILNTLKLILGVNTICISTIDNTLSNKVIQSFNHRDTLIQNGDVLPLHVCRTPHHNAMYGSSNLWSEVFYKADSMIPLGTICLLDKEPIHLSFAQMESIKSMASLLGHLIELENASLTDSLTGLYNRRYISHLHNKGTNNQYTALFIDIDDFKDVNDRYGHDTGDALLQEIAYRLKSSVRKSDIVIRYGGDEFLIFFQHLMDSIDVDIVTEKLKPSLKQPYYINGQCFYINASVGISSRQGCTTSLLDLISDADQSMYSMKHTEKNH